MTTSAAPGRLPRPLLALFAGAVVLAVAAATLSLHDPGASASQGAPRAAAQVLGPPPTAVRSPAAVLRAWDAARSRAWARGDVVGLRALYADGSSAGAADVDMLRAWTARGLRVTGLRLEVQQLVVRSRSASRLVLRVTDQEVGATARGHGHVTPLPVDHLSTRRIELRRLRDGPWRVVSVADV